jgi:hypothetical protein
MVLRPFHPRVARGNGRFPVRRLLPGAIGLALLMLGLSGIAANAATPPAGCVPISYTACVANGVTYTSNPNAIYSNATVYTAVSAPAYVAYTAPTTASTGYPPNTVISTYFDPRYCGNGAVSVVTDSSGNLIDVCTSTGVRIYPVFADYGYGYGYGYPYGYVGGYYGGCPVGNYTCLRAGGYYYP